MSNKASEIMKQVIETVTASSEDDVENLLTKLINPSNSRNEMGNVYNMTLGYNPIDHFDRADMKKIISQLRVNAPDKECADAMSSHEEEIIDTAMKMYDENRTEYLEKAICRSIEEIVGWCPDEDLVDDATDDDDADDDLYMGYDDDDD